MKDYTILVVDDEEIILDSITDYLDEYRIQIYIDPEEACKDLEENFYDIIISDYKMPKKNGLDLFFKAKKKKAYHYGILLTAYADKRLLEEFIDKNVIKKVLEKPLNLEELNAAVDIAIEECQKMREEKNKMDTMEVICQEAFRGLDFLNDTIIGMDSGLKEVMKKIEYIAPTNENVLITGETGTGKEVIARTIHFTSNRKDGPFIKINCGAIPDNLIESELFGYMRGAFSGAHKDKPGKIELAHQGTLFLDEIGELNPDMQTRFLQVIQEKQLERLGSNKTIPVDFRLISATNRNLETSIQEKLFRDDLFYRISTFPIHVPPLRDREDDIDSLVKYLILKYSRELGYHDLVIDSSALVKLKEYSWPGNIREMENVIKRAILTLDRGDREISAGSFDYLFYSSSDGELSYDTAIDIIKENILNKKNDLKSVEKEIINSILTHFNGNVKEAVEKSGIPKDRFYRNR